MLNKIPLAIRQNIFYALGIVVMKGVSFFMLPFVAHHLTPADYGKLEVLNSLGAVGSIIVGFGLLNTLFRFASEDSCSQKQTDIVAEIVGINLLIACVVLIIGLAFVSFINHALPGELGAYNIRIAVAMIALEGCIAIPMGWLRMKDKAGLFFLLNATKAIIQAGLVIVFLNQGRGLEGIMEAGLISASLLAALLIIKQVKETQIRFFSDKTRKFLKYSFPMVGSGLLGFVLTGLDRWLLADSVGTSELAQYAIAAKFAMVGALLLQPFLMWWSPRRFMVLREQHGVQKAADFAAIGSGLSMGIAVVVGIISPILISYLLPSSYADSYQYVTLLVLSIAIKDSGELLNLGCYTGDNTNLQFKINLSGSAIGLAGMLMLIPNFGIWGAIVALLVAQMCRFLLYVVLSQRELYLPYPYLRLLSMFGIMVLALYLNAEISSIGSRLLLLVAATVVLSAMLINLKGTNNEIGNADVNHVS